MALYRDTARPLTPSSTPTHSTQPKLTSSRLFQARKNNSLTCHRSQARTHLIHASQPLEPSLSIFLQPDIVLSGFLIGSALPLHSVVATKTQIEGKNTIRCDVWVWERYLLTVQPAHTKSPSEGSKHDGMIRHDLPWWKKGRAWLTHNPPGPAALAGPCLPIDQGQERKKRVSDAGSSLSSCTYTLRNST